MVKSGNTITTNLVLEKPTEEKNGVEVTIKNIPIITPYKRALKYIVFFPNVYIDGIENDNNTTTLKMFNNFAVASCRIEPKILLGNVLYPCNNSMLSIPSRAFLDNIEYSGIVIKFEVGELSITPNRESIIYSSDTIAKINERISDAKKELDGMVAKKCNKNYDNLYELYNAVKGTIGYNPIEDSYFPVSSRYGVKGSCYFTTVNTNTITFKGNSLSKDDINIIIRFFGIELPNIKGLFYNGKFYQAKIPINAQDKLKTTQPRIVCLTGNTRLSALAKCWLEGKYSEYTIITHFTKEDFRSYIFNAIPVLRYPQFPNRSTLLEYMYDHIMSKIIPINMDTNSELLAYKESFKAEKTPTVRIKNFIIYVHKSMDYRNQEYFTNIEDCIKYLKELKKGVILTDMQGPSSWYEIAAARNLVFVKARKDVVEALEERNPTFLVDKEWLATKDPTIVKLHTVLKTFKGKAVPSMYLIQGMLKTVPDFLKDQFKDIIKCYYRFLSLDTYFEMAKIKCTTIDKYTENICKKLLKYNAIYNKTCAEIGIPTDDKGDLSNVLVTAVLIKNKAYRVDFKAYNKVKNNKLLRVLCRK